MKKIIMILFILSFAAPSMAATVGGPDITIPEESLFLKEEAVKTTLDRFEFDMDIRASMNIEVNFKKNLTSSQEV
ncbi:MAG: hypothetical protein KJ952_00865, partial [Candidatus Omnitrophica bacterium]|nr:hypothetical protein [Candidatus Omnitrophota bacterium]